METINCYSVAICFILENDFDYISPEQSEAINRSFAEIRKGDCVSFNSSEEMEKYFVEQLGAEINPEEVIL